MPDLLQIGVSLAAIGLLVLLAWGLGLGPARPFATPQEALAAARELDDGFEPSEAAVDGNGRAAIIAAHDGRMMVVKAHGNRWAGRILEQTAKVTGDGDTVQIDVGEARFGIVTLHLGDSAQTWANRAQRL